MTVDAAALQSDRYPRTNEFLDVLHELRGKELRKLPPGANTVLHGGCDGSWYFRWFDERYPTPPKRHIGVELYAPMPDDLPPSVEWLSQSLGDLSSLVDGEVDLVFAGQVIEHLWPEDIFSFLCEAHRVLTPDGWLALDSPNARVTSALRWVQPEHTVEFTADEISELLELAGFVDTRIRGLWLCYDRSRHRFLPIESLDESDEWPRARRIAEAETRPEDSFVWWTEARRGLIAPRRGELRQRVQEIAQRFRREQLSIGFRNQIGSVEIRGDERHAFAPAGESGFLIFGPYMPLPPGRWRATYRIGVTVANGEQLPAAELVAFVDVAARNDAEQLATRDLTLRELPPDGALHEIVLPFELAETTFGVQFRLYTTGRVSVFARSQVELEEDSAAPGPAVSPEITEPRAAPEAQAASPPAEDAASNEAPPAAVQRDRREDGPVSTPAPARSSDGAPARYEVSLPRRVGRILLWPFLRFFDPRFQGLAEQLEAKHEDLGWRVDRSKDEAARTHVLVSRLRTESGTVRNETLAALDEIRILLHMEITNAAEATTQLGASLVDLESLVEGGRADLARLRSSTSRKQAADERTARQIDEIAAESHRIIETTADLRRESRGMQEALAEVAAAARGAQEEASKASGAYLEQLASVDASQLDSRVAPLLERENTPTGLAARHGLWFNPPVYVGYESTVPVVRGVNERIAENAYAFAAIAGLELGAPILDVGAAESLTAFSLASLGYPVTALDPRGYPLPHPLLQVVTVPIQDWQTEDRYAAVLCISTIEHVGLPAYGLRPAEGRADLAAMRRIWELTAPGGLLVLTTPYGQPNETAFSRTYDRAGLDELLDRWQLEDFRLLGREDGTTWRVVDAVADAASGEAVALVTARRSG